MEIIVRIKNISDVFHIEYTNQRTNQKESLACRGFVLSDGIDTFYAEMRGQMAEQWHADDWTKLYKARVEFTSRTYTRSDGSQAWSNDARIVKLVQI